MRCCVPFCRNASDHVSTSEGNGIRFYDFPSELHLRAAWLRALGKQDSHLPDSAVVCSQHFLNDDIYETQCGVRQIVTGAIPSTVQVCMICLDTDSKLILMSKHKMEEAYEKLTGYPLCDQGNLKQTLCVQCAQKLINFSRFRDKSLRARALMTDLVDKHKLITRRHIKMINRTKHQLKSSMVLTTLGPDHCDLHILEHPSEDKLTEIEETGPRDVVKTEESDDSISVDGDMEVILEDNYVNDIVQDPLKNESASFQCTLCLEEFFHEHAYIQHMSVHLQNGAGDGECDTSQVCEPHTAVSSSSSHSSLITENKQADPSPSPQAALTTVVPLSARLVSNNEINHTEEVDTNVSCRYKRLPDCFVKLYDIFANKVVQRQDVSLMKTQGDAMSCDSLNTVSKDCSYQATSQNVVPMTEYIEPVTNSCGRVKVIVLNTLPSSTYCLNNVINKQCINSSLSSSHTENISFICDICGKNYNRKSLLVIHLKTHSEGSRLTCKICQYKCKFKSQLAQHMRTHNKPFTCNICNSKFAHGLSLLYHMRTHTGIKPYACELCEYKCTQKSYLGRHMRAHTGEKPFTCKICNKNFATSSNLVVHMRTHTGEKPFSCNICEYKFTQKCNLMYHMTTHAGEKSHSCAIEERQFTCKICQHKFKRKSQLTEHMRTHTGEKPFTCNICNSKFARNNNLVYHMTTHTGIKPYACELCEYKCAKKSRVVRHMRRHNGEKPHSCQKCEYKCVDKRSLIRHMINHTDEKPFFCNICNSKFAYSSHLVKHMRTHTGIKPYACELCEYKCARKSSLVLHVRVHTDGEKPYSCQKCEYKCARKTSLVKHMRTHTSSNP